VQGREPVACADLSGGIWPNEGECWVGGPAASAGTDWRRPALAMFAAGYGANQFVPLLAVYRSDLHLSDAAATATASSPSASPRTKS